MVKKISNIVFTKNRPLQLDGYLTSLYRFFPTEAIQTYILYKEELFSDSYEKLFAKFPDCIVVREKNFHKDFMDILNSIDTKYILFGVDDVIYFDSVDLAIIDKCFDDFSNDIFGFSLRFNKRTIGQGQDKLAEYDIANQKVYSLNWQNGKSPATSYPFELCATVYLTELVKDIIQNQMNSCPLCKKMFTPGSCFVETLGRVLSKRKLLKSFGYFFSPNTLESWNCRWCKNNPSKVPISLYFQKNCAVAIQINMVNTSTINEIESLAEHTVEALDEKYKQGYEMDVNFVIENKPEDTHSKQELFKLSK